MNYAKIAPGLINVVEDYRQHGRPGLSSHVNTLGFASAIEDSVKPARTVVFLHVEPEADLSELAAMDVTVNKASGPIRTAIAPLESLAALSEAPAIRQIVPAHYLSERMDLAAAAVQLDNLRLPENLSGQGVLIGVVDSGIDPHHPAFAGRVLRVWDQVLSGPGVPEGRYGVELEGPLLEVSRDLNGHGTHVAGIAAGRHDRFGGVAPGADLLIVKTDRQDAHIADAIRYLFRLAGELDRPIVANLSLGGHADAHDGSDPLSLIIDQESGPGRIVCCAAGNESNDNIHASARVGQGQTRSIQFHVPEPFGGAAPVTLAVLNGWYSGADEMEVAVRSPSGFMTEWQGVLAQGNPARLHALPDGNIRIITPGPDPINGDHQFVVEVRSQGNPTLPVTARTWRLELRGATVSDEGRVDVWVLDNSQQQDVLFTGGGVDSSMKIGSPGAAAKALTVAAYTTRAAWTDSQGRPQSVGLAANTIADFSNEGPLRDGRPKPDFAAPGAMIAAPLSADSQVPDRFIVVDGYRLNGGTSMATPFITGVVALLLERDPTLTPGQVKDLLADQAAIPGLGPGTFDVKWGHGLIDCDAVARAILNQGDGQAMDFSKMDPSLVASLQDEGEESARQHEVFVMLEEDPDPETVSLLEQLSGQTLQQGQTMLSLTLSAGDVAVLSDRPGVRALKLSQQRKFYDPTSQQGPADLFGDK